MRPVVCALLGVLAGGRAEEYQQGSAVELFANKARPLPVALAAPAPPPNTSAAGLAAQVGPFANPSEVYSFYNLPFCAPAEIEIEREDLGPLLKGDRPTNTLYDIKFRESAARKTLCRKHLDDTELAKFKKAIVEDYYFEMMLDELPIWGYVGELETKSVNLQKSYDNSTRYDAARPDTLSPTPARRTPDAHTQLPPLHAPRLLHRLERQPRH